MVANAQTSASANALSVSAAQVCPTLLNTSEPTSTLLGFARECCVTAIGNATLPMQVSYVAWQAWLYGLLFVTAICLSTVAPLAVFPFIRRSTYDMALKFLLALAIGSLCTTSILFLIPEALDLPTIAAADPRLEGFQYKGATVCAGIYIFLIGEYFIQKMIRKMHPPPEESHDLDALRRYDISAHENGEVHVVHSSIHSLHCVASAGENGDRPKRRVVQPVAYMMLLGDSLVSFVDGLALGTAYADSVVNGISLSLPVLCEELPHRFGDFAVMVTAGLPMRRAALYNLLCTSWMYVGFVIGILVGDKVGASPYIFAIAAGMFLYLSLVDMLPELLHGEHSHDEAPSSQRGKPQVPKGSGIGLFILQNVGILLGFATVFVFSIFGPQIEHAVQSGASASH